MDKATQNMCKKSEGVKSRLEPGVEVFQVKVTQKKKAGSKRKTLQANVFPANVNVDSMERINRLHCHLSCANYTKSCETPTGCRQKRLSKEKCPITKHVGYHSCGLTEMMSKKDYIIEQRRRKEEGGPAITTHRTNRGRGKNHGIQGSMDQEGKFLDSP